MRPSPTLSSAPTVEVGVRTGTLSSYRAPGPIVLDAVGALLVAATIAWTFISARVPGSATGPVAALVGVCVVAFAVGRFSRRERWLAPLLVTAVGVAVFAQSSQKALDAGPLGGPLGYVNARGAFFAQAVAAALILTSIWRHQLARMLVLAAAVAFVAVTFSGGSAAAMVSSVALVVTAVAGRRRRGARVVVVLSGVAFLATLAATTVLAATYSPRDSGGLNQIVNRTVGGHRVELWHEGLSLMRDNPATGVGAGRFREVSALARADVDSRWAHHAFLQQGAEAGVVGYAILALLFLWGFARLWFSPKADTVTSIGAVALAALGMHACVDYILHFAAVPIAAAAVLGAAVGSRDAA
jgi:O-antigen ligase